MNRQSKEKLVKLVAQCEDALREKGRQSHLIFRGDMWAILSAAHELRKRGLLEIKRRDEATSGDCAGDLASQQTKTRAEAHD